MDANLILAFLNFEIFLLKTIDKGQKFGLVFLKLFI